MAYLDLQDGGEGLGVLGHAPQVQRMEELGGVVVLILNLHHHLGCVGWTHTHTLLNTHMQIEFNTHILAVLKTRYGQTVGG